VAVLAMKKCNNRQQHGHPAQQRQTDDGNTRRQRWQPIGFGPRFSPDALGYQRTNAHKSDPSSITADVWQQKYLQRRQTAIYIIPKLTTIPGNTLRLL
jgi:hypothetical protein